MAPPPPTLPPRTDATASGHCIFISYASRDSDVADRVVAALEDRGLKCWISSRDIPPGADYQARIVAAIEAAPVMLLLLSRNAVASKEMPKETSIASQLGRDIVPVLIDNTAVTGALSYQATNAQRLNLSADFDAGVDRLARGLAHTLDLAAYTEKHLRRLASRRRVMGVVAWLLAAALLVAGAAAIWHFQVGLRALLGISTPGATPTPQGATAAPQAETPPQPVQKPAVQPPAPAPEATDEDLVRAFVERYYAALSGPAEQVPGFFEKALQDPVQFYGRALPRRTLVAEEINYTQRWPDRSFVIRPGTLAVACRPDLACSATGVIDYTVRSAARHAASSGAERFDLRIASPNSPHLISITTAPIERHVQAQP